MAKKFSIAHLTALGLAPPELTYMAAELGYDFVSYRIIPLNLPGEPRHVIAEDPALLKRTKAALAETGLPLLDIEVVRIVDGIDVRQFVPALAAGAELGARHVLTASGATDRSFAVDAYAQLCELAAQYGLTVDLEFIAFSAVKTLQMAVEFIRDVNQPNAAVLIDTLHSGFSHMAPEELDALPPSLFNYAQLGDAKILGTLDNAEMTRIAREERYFLGEGTIPVKTIVEHLPELPLSLEITHKQRIQDLGYPEFARQCLAAAKACLGE